MKWINRLSDKELLAMHTEAVCGDTANIVEKYYDADEDCFYIEFLENWPDENGSPNYVPTAYHYYDYNCRCFDSTVNIHAYIEWLIKKFGKHYIAAMLTDKYRLDEKLIKKTIGVK